LPTIEFWPSQPHHLLELGDRTVTAGETFEVSEEDALELLTAPGSEFRDPHESQTADAPPADGDSEPKAPAKTHSPAGQSAQPHPHP
jgi:hypothetical protein